MEYQYGNIKYTLGQGFDYSTDKEVEKPVSLVKYYGLSKYSIDALVNNYMYGSHPYNLNDLLD